MKNKLLMLTATAATFALTIGAAHADPGHHHGAKSATYDGHAAALGEPGDPKARARVVTVAMNDEMRFQPSQITVAKGETIKFVVKNNGQLRHEMTLGTMAELVEHAKVMEKHPEMEHDDPNAVTVDPGKTKSIIWKFTKAGSFDFGCLVPGHMEGGMNGRIVVQ